jgi:HlyD family secretion protein
MTARRTASSAAILAPLLLAACEPASAPAMLGTLERDRLELIAQAQEEIKTMHVREGARVAQGDTLVELDSTAIDAQLAQARARASEARARLAELEHGPRAEQIAAARAQLAEDEARVVVETKEYDRQLDLVKRKLVSQSNVDRQRAARDGAIAARRRSAAQLEELETGTRSEQVDQARENVASSDAAVQSLEIDAARLVIRAPRKGFIDALPYKLGERPPQGAPVVVMLADDAPYARVYLPEPLFSQMHVGDDVSVQIDGADHAYAGRVRFLSAQAAFTPYYALTQRDRSRLSYLMEVTLTEPAAKELPTGVPVEVRTPAIGGGR